MSWEIKLTKLEIVVTEIQYRDYQRYNAANDCEGWIGLLSLKLHSPMKVSNALTKAIVLISFYLPINIVIGVMKIGNIAPIVGIERTPFAFHCSVLTVTPPRLSDVPILSTPTCLCSSLPDRSALTSTLVALEL